MEKKSMATREKGQRTLSTMYREVKNLGSSQLSNQNWPICVWVHKKYEARFSFNGCRYLKMVLADNSGKIQAMVYDNVDEYDQLFTTGKRYIIRNAFIKATNTQFETYGHDYELVLTKSTIIHECNMITWPHLAVSSASHHPKTKEEVGTSKTKDSLAEGESNTRSMPLELPDLPILVFDDDTDANDNVDDDDTETRLGETPFIQRKLNRSGKIYKNVKSALFGAEGSKGQRKRTEKKKMVTSKGHIKRKGNLRSGTTKGAIQKTGKRNTDTRKASVSGKKSMRRRSSSKQKEDLVITIETDESSDDDPIIRRQKKSPLPLGSIEDTVESDETVNYDTSDYLDVGTNSSDEDGREEKKNQPYKKRLRNLEMEDSESSLDVGVRKTRRKKPRVLQDSDSADDTDTDGQTNGGVIADDDFSNTDDNSDGTSTDGTTVSEQRGDLNDIGDDSYDDDDGDDHLDNDRSENDVEDSESFTSDTSGCENSSPDSDDLDEINDYNNDDHSGNVRTHVREIDEHLYAKVTSFVYWIVMKAYGDASVPENDPNTMLYVSGLLKEVEGKMNVCISQAWSTDVKRSFELCPIFEKYEKTDPSDIQFLKDCEICNRSNHPWKYRVTLRGAPYDKKTLKKKGVEEGPCDYVMGQYCYRRVKYYHQLYHLEYTLLKECKKKLRNMETPDPDKLSIDEAFLDKQYRKIEKLFQDVELEVFEDGDAKHHGTRFQREFFNKYK